MSTPVYTNEKIAEFKLYPGTKICIHFVKANIPGVKVVKHCDIRVYKENNQYKKWLPTSRGFTVKKEQLLQLYNGVVKLDISDFSARVNEENTYSPFTKLKKYDTIYIVIGVAWSNGMLNYDIREFKIDADKGFKGFTVKGIRVPYYLRREFLDAILDALARFENDDKKVKRII